MTPQQSAHMMHGGKVALRAAAGEPFAPCLGAGGVAGASSAPEQGAARGAGKIGTTRMDWKGAFRCTA